MALDAIIQGGLSLEGLDQFGSLDHLPYSLDDAYWSTVHISASGDSVSPTGAKVLGIKAFLGGPRRAVSPTGTFIEESWLIWPTPVISISPGGSRFGFAFMEMENLASVSPGSMAARPAMDIMPMGLPYRLVSPGAAVVRPRLRGYGWITRAV